MDALRHVRLMAEYNRWANGRVLEAAAALPAAALAEDRRAFFGSILGTLNHMAVADALWLRRFAVPGHWNRLAEADAWMPRPAGLRDVLADDLGALTELRERLDALIVGWCDELVFKDLDRVLPYRNMAGEAKRRQVGPLLSHFFNHQTHHRGQATTLLFQAGIDPGVTDLVAMPGFDPFEPNDAGRTAPTGG
ncbi:MAG TPA: DinB family protein [Burkholderiaceae bacterium]|nr:DinB family protein [Burkholderiaceae bacterium]